MTNYTHNGSYTLVGAASTTTATVNENLNNPGVTFNIAGILVATFDISSNIGSIVTVNNTVDLASTLNLNTNGGAIALTSTVSALGPVNVTIDGGGSFTVGGTLIGLLDSGTVVFSTGGGTAYFGTSGDFLNISFAPPIENITSPSDVIDDVSLLYSGLTSYTVSGTGTQTVSITSSSGTFSFTTTGSNLRTGTFSGASLTAGPLTFTADGSGGTDITVCFLRGTRIQTPDGEVPVEALGVGDLVEAQRAGETTFEPITWIGRRKMDVSTTGNRLDAYPVRIRANAFAPNIPTRDLLVTSEHCVFVDGRLVPIRLLVNGGSIVVDTSITNYEYFHVELEKHSIILAEGLTMESYLDTGNRGNFANSPVAGLLPDFRLATAHKSWEYDAAAPLAVDAETVEPIWKSLADRAVALGHDLPASTPKTSDPELCLMMDGRRIRPVSADSNRYVFMLPAVTCTLNLVSRSMVPADDKPWTDDRRHLGVKIRQMTIRQGKDVQTLPVDHPMFTAGGWWAVEHAEGAMWRWTDGNAVLGQIPGRSILEIELAAAPPAYPVLAETPAAAGDGRLAA